MDVQRHADNDLNLAVRAAWLYHAGGLKQSAISKKLGLSSVKVHRLISRVAQMGIVKVNIDGEIAECSELEYRLEEKYKLSICEVTPDLGEIGLPLRSLGIAASRFLLNTISSDEYNVIGIGHGRSLAAAVSNLPQVDAQHVKFVSLLGGVTRNFAANPHDVMHSLAARTSGSAYVMPVPFFANSVQDREVILSQRGISDVMRLAESALLKLVGIGAVKPNAQLVASNMLENSEIEEIQAKGGCGELLGHFFDRDGQLIQTELSDRTLSISVEALGIGRIVAVAGGIEKIQAIESLLKSGFLGGLITDEITAKELLNT